MVKALDKVSSKMARDYGEIENLQNNSFAALKFANACYKSIKEKMIRDLIAFNPQYNIRFLDGEEIINDKESKFCYIISPIDGLLNFSRSLTGFSNVIALEENVDGKKEITTVAISSVANNEVYIAHKGSGAFLNNRRIRASTSKPVSNIVCGIADQSLFNNKLIAGRNFKLYLNNCHSLDIAYQASGKLDLAIFSKNDQEMLKITSVLVKEAGGSVSQQGDVILVGIEKLVS
jgi:myo-inositol-1(or 4)-monophosphatase